MNTIPKPLKYGLDLLVLTLIYCIWLLPRWRSRGRTRLAVNSVMYLYLVGVLYVTLMPILAALPFCRNHPYIPMHLVPFDDILRGYGDAARQLILNVVMTVPFGFLLPLCRRCAGKKCGILRCLLLTLALSLSIELLQPLLNGARRSDITDVITNTLGGLLGYLLFLAFRPLLRRLEPPKAQ